MKGIEELSKITKESECVYVCIGTDRYVGDALGPIVGSILKDNGLSNVYGTLESPVHAVNLKKIIADIKNIHEGKKIIAIDACVGPKEHVGSFQIRQCAIYPGSGVGKKLDPVGDISIVGIVDSSENNSIFPLHNVRLGKVMEMAIEIAKTIFSVNGIAEIATTNSYLYKGERK